MTKEWVLKDKLKREVEIGDVMISSNGERYIAKTGQKFFAFDYDISALVREVYEKAKEAGSVAPRNEDIAFLMGLYR